MYLLHIIVLLVVLTASVSQGSESSKSNLLILRSASQTLIYDHNNLTFQIESLSKAKKSSQASDQHAEILIEDKKGAITKKPKSDNSWLRQGQSCIKLVDQKGYEITIPSSRLRLIDYDKKNINDELGSGSQLIVKLQDSDNLFELQQIFRAYENQSVVTLQVEIKNIGNKTLHIKEMVPLYVPSGRENLVLGNSGAITWDWYVHGYGHGHEYGARTLSLMDHYNINATPARWPIDPLHSWWYTIFGDSNIDEYAIIGAISFKNQPLTISLKIDGLGFNNSTGLSATCGGYELEPGDDLLSHEIAAYKVNTRPWTALRAFAQIISTRMRIKMRHNPPPVIWSSWYAPEMCANITEDKILKQSSRIAENRNVWPIDVIHMDYGWSESSKDPNWGNWCADPKKFPHGMKYVAEKIKSNGFVPGLWCRPTVLNAGADIVKLHPESLADPSLKGHGPYGDFMLESKHPYSKEYLKNVFEKLHADWGYGYFKIELQTDEWRDHYEIIRQVCGEDSFILSNFNFSSALGFSDFQRVTNDIHYRWEYPKSNEKWLAGPLGLGVGARDSILQYHENGLLWWIDADGITLFEKPSKRSLNKYPDSEIDYEMQFYATITGMGGGVVACYGDFAKVAPVEDNLLSCLVPSYTRPADVLDFFSKPAPEFLKLTVDKAFEQWYVVAALNWGDSEKSNSINCDLLELDATKSYHVFDFWNWKYLGTLSGELKLPPQKGRQALLLAVRENTGDLQLLSTSCHITQGGVELKNVEASSTTYKATIQRPYGKHTTNLAFFVPNGKHLTCMCDAKPVTVKQLCPNVYQVTLTYNNEATFIANLN